MQTDLTIDELRALIREAVREALQEERAAASAPPPEPPPAPGPKPKFKKRTIPHDPNAPREKPRPEDYEFAARWAQKHRLKHNLKLKP